MKKAFFVTIAAVFLGLNSFSQQAFSEIGVVMTQFDYENSRGEGLENAFSKSGLHFAAGYRMPLGELIFGVASATFNNYGTRGSIETYDLVYDYNLNYLGLNLGVDLEFFRKKGFNFFGRFGVEPQFLLSGTRTLGDAVEDLTGQEEFDSAFLFTKGGLGVNYCVDGQLAFHLRYDYGLGFPTSSGGEETLRFRTSTISFGVIINFKFCDYCLKSKSK